jgi:hypothetical protein
LCLLGVMQQVSQGKAGHDGSLKLLPGEDEAYCVPPPQVCTVLPCPLVNAHVPALRSTHKLTEITSLLGRSS